MKTELDYLMEALNGEHVDTPLTVGMLRDAYNKAMDKMEEDEKERDIFSFNPDWDQ